MVDARRTHELQDLLGHAMHVDGERNAAIANKREPEFFFLHRPSARRTFRRRCGSRVSNASLGSHSLMTN